MITRFDHAVIGVSDLPVARAAFRDRLGFEVYPGGRHTGLGTENAIVRFGLDYLELIGIYDRDEVAAAGIKRAALLDFLARRDGGMLGYCLATDDIDDLAARFERTGLEALGPYAMERMRPDGLLLKWQLLVPGGTAWRRPWPFFIQWEMPDNERLELERPGRHRNGAAGVMGVSVVVHDIEAAEVLYSDQLGLERLAATPLDGAQRLRYHVGEFTIDLIQPTSLGPMAAFLDEFDQGLHQVRLATEDLATSKVVLDEGQVSTIAQATSALAVVAQDALGAELVFGVR